MMVDRLAEKTKDIEQIYFENNLLANKLFDLKEKLEKLGQTGGQIDDFNVRDCATYALSFLNSSRIHAFKK